MFSKILLSITVLLVAASLFITYYLGYYQYSYTIIPTGILLAIVLVFRKEMERWQLLKGNQVVPEGLQKFLIERTPFYRQLTSPQRMIFNRHFNVFRNWEFMMMTGEKSNQLIEVIVAANVARISCSHENKFFDLVKDFAKVVIYGHSFPSPHYPELHCSEIHFEDETAIFSADHIIKSFQEPEFYFNPVLYEFSKFFLDRLPLNYQPDTGKLEKISDFTSGDLLNYLRMSEKHLDFQAVAIHHYLSFSEKYREIDPQGYTVIHDYLHGANID